MDEQARALLAIAARLTDYPADSFHEELGEIREFTTSQFEMGPLRFALNGALEELHALSLREARERYVSIFDLKDRTSLFLTAHELGDSRKRGVALIELRQYLREGGFEPLGYQLPDYIPMLYEWCAEAPQNESWKHMIDRLSYATQRICKHLPADHPLKPIFEALMTVVFDERSEQAMMELERNREKPDLDPMPYPLMYK